VVLRALALLQLAADASAPQIARVIPLTAQSIRRLGHRYQQAGLDCASMRDSGRAPPKCWTTPRVSSEFGP